MDEDGQLIIISGFIIAMSLIILTIMLSSIIYTGNIAYEGTMETHERNMLDINRMTIDETHRANGTPCFENYMRNYTEYVAALSAYKGASVSIDYSALDTSTRKGNICMNYSDTIIRSKYNLTFT